MKQLENLQSLTGRNVIYYGAVSDSLYLELSLGSHFYTSSLSTSESRASLANTPLRACWK